ncbi:MAG TPA: hypothetical protein PKC19_23085, partial [Roseiflexaceae bacterium]|nr:hypothetical protein [Roseiflexaceae bacterium]
ARYRIRWIFADQSITNLDADLWHNLAGERFRVQLVHASGGAPYEFVAGDGAGRFWYTLAPLYSSSVAPLAFDEPLRYEYTMVGQTAERMLQHRLAAGAWAIADDYLPQAGGAARMMMVRSSK